jgi:hypothetical protein
MRLDRRGRAADPGAHRWRHSDRGRFRCINIRRIRFSVLLLPGVVAGITRVLDAGRLHSGRFGAIVLTMAPARRT